MKNTLIKRALVGCPVGIAIGYVITVLISVSVGDGNFYPVVPAFADAMQSELNAVVLQTVLCALMGGAYAMASVIWELDSWSLAKQTGIYFAVICAATLPIAYVANWMEHTVRGVVSYIGIFVAIFVFIWVLQYFLLKKKIAKMNGALKKEHQS